MIVVKDVAPDGLEAHGNVIGKLYPIGFQITVSDFAHRSDLLLVTVGAGLIATAAIMWTVFIAAGIVDSVPSSNSSVTSLKGSTVVEFVSSGLSSARAKELHERGVTPGQGAI